MLLSCVLIPSAIATDNVIELSVIGSESSEELSPMMANECEDIDFDYYSQNYPIYSSLQGCAGYDGGFSPSGAAFYKPMTNLGLQLYFQFVSPGTWKKGYQNGYYDGVKYSIHYFKNITDGSAYSGYKLVEGWVK